MNETGHDFDYVTRYCLRCGCAAQGIVEQPDSECISATNVIAISHRVRDTRLRDFIMRLEGRRS